jgi:hypothetical protein
MYSEAITVHISTKGAQTWKHTKVSRLTEVATELKHITEREYED